MAQRIAFKLYGDEQIAFRNLHSAGIDASKVAKIAFIQYYNQMLTSARELEERRRAEQATQYVEGEESGNGDSTSYVTTTDVEGGGVPALSSSPGTEPDTP